MLVPENETGDASVSPFSSLLLTQIRAMRNTTIDPNRYIKRRLTTLKHSVKRAWRKLTTKENTLYLINDTMYQMKEGKYIKIGDLCNMYEGDKSNIPQAFLTT